MPHVTNDHPPIKHVAIIGCGSIGASWAALFLAQGLTVTAFDINPASKTFLHNLVSAALPTLKSLGLLKNPSAAPENITFTTNLEDAVRHADFIQENGPEKLEFKQKLFTDLSRIVRDDVIIATSSSGLTCSSIQAGVPEDAYPERFVVGHPFNPPHLIPLVEVVGGDRTSAKIIDRTMDFYTAMGKKAVHVKKEAKGHIANRLQAALMREALYLVQEDICNVKDIDEAMAYGPGLRWGVMGPNTLMHLAGGEGGAQHLANHLLGPLMTWFAPQDPVLDDNLKKKWVDETLDAVGGRRYQDLSKQRDEELVQLLNVRKEWDDWAENRLSEGSSQSSLAPHKNLYILDTDLIKLPGKCNGRIVTCGIDGSDLHTVIDNIPTMPDGITIDHSAGKMYWTNMGTSFNTNDGSIESANLDGSDRQTVIPTGAPGVQTPKQISLAEKSRKLYWCDREGMKVCRSNLDGSEKEILIDTSSTDTDKPSVFRWCVGITVDEARGWFYWTQKGPSKGKQGRIFRARIDNPAERELLFENLPEPIDLELDEETATLYWTDRGDPPTGNSLNRAVVDGVAGKREREVLARRLHETIGLALDRQRKVCFVTDLSGGVYEVDVETKEKKVLFAELGDLTGIALA